MPCATVTLAKAAWSAAGAAELIWGLPDAPELLAAFRTRLVQPRRAALSRALTEGINAGELPSSAARLSRG